MSKATFGLVHGCFSGVSSRKNRYNMQLSIVHHFLGIYVIKARLRQENQCHPFSHITKTNTGAQNSNRIQPVWGII